MPVEATVTHVINEATLTNVATKSATSGLSTELTVTIVGVTTVFLVFVILYIVFKSMEVMGISKDKKMRIPSQKEVKEISESEKQISKTDRVSIERAVDVDNSEEVAAIFAAIYATLGTNVVVHSIKQVEPRRSAFVNISKGQRGWEEWRTYGWRGGNR